MAFQGPKVPHRTARSIALEHGTAAAGFDGAVTPAEYSPQAGTPSAMSGGEYRGQKPQINSGAPPRDGKVPFTLGK